MSGNKLSQILGNLQFHCRTLQGLVGCPVDRVHLELACWAASLMEARVCVVLLEDTEGRAHMRGYHGLEVTAEVGEEIAGRILRLLYEADAGAELIPLAALPKEVQGVLGHQGLLGPLLRVALHAHNQKGLEVRGCLLFAGLSPELAEDQQTQLSEIAAQLLANQLLAQEVVHGMRAAHTSLSDARESIAAASRVKTDFLANISHEIRTPMTSILGYAELLRDKAIGRDEGETLDTILRNGRHLLEIINDVLDLSELEAGSLLLNPAETDLRHVVGGALMAVEGDARDKDLALQVAVQGDVPLTIHSDPGRLTQVLRNVLHNAVKFTDQGGVQLVLRHCHDDPDQGPKLIFEVSDTGVGISEEQQASLFQPFHQVDTSMTRRFGGAGMGLCIARRVAGLLGGDIELSSKPGKGTRVTIRVAAAPGEGSPMVSGAQLQQALEARRQQLRDSVLTLTGSRHPLGGRHVLLVEDGRDNQLLISSVLKKMGADVTLAEDGRQGCDRALAAMRCGAPYDVVLMDMQMPVMDGYAATRELRDEGFDGPVIALTAHAMTQDRARCLEAGCSEYTSKPINKIRLLSLMLSEMSR